MTIQSERVRVMTASDAAPAADLLRRGEFGERHGFFEWALARPTITAFVAEVDGRIAGTGVASVHGPVGWVGVIYVAPDARRNGLGQRITRTVIDHLEASGCRTLLLIASPMGRPIYEREGFDVLDRQVRFTVDALPADDAPSEPLVRAFSGADLEAALRLDRFATGEDREPILRALLNPSSTLVAVGPDDDVRGYAARAPWRGGAIIAPDPDDALRLLERRRHVPGVSGKTGAGVLASNEAGRARLRAAGWTEEPGGVRMIRGEPLDWHPEAIWGQFNGALG
jgi:GNAT superfamily N-acetyltransferase